MEAVYDPNELLTIEDIMATCKVSRRAAYRVAHAIPKTLRMGSRKGIRVRRRHLDEFLDSRPTKES